jgi:uncharacterized protein YjiS (DUF1127 family)
MENTTMTMITESRADMRSLAATGLLSAIASHFAAYRRSRRVLKDLAAMDDHVLKDIGLSRVDVVQATVAEIGTDRMAMLQSARISRIL